MELQDYLNREPEERLLSNTILNLKITVYWFRRQNYFRALKKMTEVFDYVNDLLVMLSKPARQSSHGQYCFDVNVLLEILKECMEAQQKKDYVLTADYLELRLYPWLFPLLQELLEQRMECQIKQQGEDLSGLNLEYAADGELTAQKNGIYLHSNEFPLLEGMVLAESWMKENCDHYTVCGIGLAYHISALFSLNECAEIIVYESDERLIQAALKMNGIEEKVKEGRLVIKLDKGYQKFLSCFSTDNPYTEYRIHYPSISVLPEGSIKSSLEELFIGYSSVVNQKRIMAGNFRKNITLNDPSVDEILKTWTGKTLYIIAAGPSLDQNFLKLKEVSQGIILATGTVLRKLLSAGIRPDYVIITDPQEPVRRQTEKLENCGVPLLYISTTYDKIAESYQGNRYIILQKGYRKAEEYAQEKGSCIIETGGSVTTTAVELGISASCRRIVFLGLDLAYTGNTSHAGGTPRKQQINMDKLPETVAIDGSLVKTANNMNIYRHWLEQRIRKNPATEFIDATEGGALIHGTRIMSMEEVLAAER